VKKDDLKKMLEDDFFGEGDLLSGLDDLSLGDDSKESLVKESFLEEEETEVFDLDLESDDKDVFNLDGFNFDDKDLLGSDLDLDELDKELELDDNQTNNSDEYISVSQNELGDISSDINEILSKSMVQIDEEEEAEEEVVIPEEPEESEENDQEDFADFATFKDNNSFTNYAQNDTINIDEDFLEIEENKGTEMGNMGYDYNQISEETNQDFVNVKKLDFPEINNLITGSKFKVDLFSNIPVTIDVFLGKTTLSLKDVHDLSKGSVIELDKFYGEPLELKINGELIATGEVVAIDNKYGIMIKDIVKS